MGSFPTNWTSETSRMQKAVARAAVQNAQSNPNVSIGSQLGVIVRYLPDKLDPATGTFGLWEIQVEKTFKLGDPYVYYRHDEQEAAECLSRNMSQNLYDGYISGRQAIEYVQQLDDLVPGPRNQLGRIRPVRSQRAYIQEGLTGSDTTRFFSSDVRFPISISFPSDLSFFFDFNRAENLQLKCWASSDEVLRVTKEDLRSARDRDAREYINGGRNLSWLMERSMENKKKKYQLSKKERDFVPLGTGKFRVPVISWVGGESGEMVFFPGREAGIIWSIARFGNAVISAEKFRLILLSFNWLDEEFYRSIDAL